MGLEITPGVRRPPTTYRRPGRPPRLPGGVSQVWLASHTAAGGIVRHVAGNDWLTIPATVEALKQLGQQRGIGYTTLMAQIIESAVAEMTADDQAMVPLADVRRAIAQLAHRNTPAA